MYVHTYVRVCVQICMLHILLFRCSERYYEPGKFHGRGKCNVLSCVHMGQCSMCHGAGAKVGWFKEYRLLTFTM